MDFNLEKVTNTNIEYLEKTKLYNIFQYAHDLPGEEIERIKRYVKSHIPMELENYRIIKIDNEIVGCVLVVNKDDGVMLDEIYIESDFRNKGIGTKIIKEILQENKVVYLWVYKENEKAISLYKKLGFKVVDETDTRFFMKYEQ